ncbi:tetratricopeptide repeat protein [Marinobacteraceae bacterium S3BR75-40.1]
MQPTLKKNRYLWACLFALCPGLLYAQDLSKGSSDSAGGSDAAQNDQSVTETLKTRYRNGRFEAAYDYGQAHQLDMEGQQQFDFYFGLAALKAGHYSEALFNFERLVALYPDQPRFRLEYARTLFHLKKYPQSQEQFQRVLAGEPPANVKANIQKFLDVIEQRQAEANKHWNGHIALGAGYDSNINNATDERIVGLFELPDSAMETESAFISANTGVAYERALNQQSSYRLGLSTQHKKNLETSDYDLDSGAVDLSWTQAFGDSEVSPSLTYQHVLLDGEEYQRNMGVAAQWKEPWLDRFMTVVYGGIFQRDSFVNPLLDNYQPLVSLTGLLPSGRWLHALTLAGGSENPRRSDADHLAKEFGTLSYRIDFKATPTVIPFAKLSGFAANYKDENPVFGETRKDRSYQVSVGVNWQLNRKVNILAHTGYTDNASTIDLYDYTRWKTEIQASWQF